MLTPTQLKLYNFIANRLATTGCPPSFDEMREHMGLQSKSGISRLVEQLEERRVIVRLAKHSRGIALARSSSTHEFATCQCGPCVARRIYQQYRQMAAALQNEPPARIARARLDGLKIIGRAKRLALAGGIEPKAATRTRAAVPPGVGQ